MSTLGENNDWGGYIVGIMQIEGAFRIDGTNNPDAVHDGGTNVIESVERESAGLFTVTFASKKDGVPYVPAQVLRCPCEVTASDATPVKTVVAQYVTGSWDPATRSFQIVTIKVGDTGESGYFDAAPDDPDDNTWVSFCLRGPASPAGNDYVAGTNTLEEV